MPSQIVKHGVLALAVVLVCVNETLAQVISSIKDGKWSSPSTWSGGLIPDFQNSSRIEVNHRVTIPEDTVITVDEAVINSELIVQARSAVTITGDSLRGISLAPGGSLSVFGTIICSDGATLAGTSQTNTTFHNGSVFLDLSAIEGVIPLAMWSPESTYELSGLSESVSMKSVNWSQPFGNFIYDCPAQGNFSDFNGLLRHIQGDLTIRSTNARILRFARGHTLSMIIEGNLRIEGASEVWFGETSNNVSVLVHGNFDFSTAAGTASSYFTSSGQTTFTVQGDVTVNSVSKLKMTAGSATQTSNLFVGGDFNLFNGTIDALGTGRGTITFNGGDVQTFNRVAGTAMDGNLDYVVASGSTLALGESILSNTLSGGLLVSGTLQVGSPDPSGALNNSGGNVQVIDGMQFTSGSAIVYAGDELLYLGDAHPASSEVSISINNPAGVVLLNDIVTADLTIVAGSLTVASHSARVAGDLLIEDEGSIGGEINLVLNGGNTQVLHAQGHTLHDIVVQKTGGDVNLTSGLSLSGTLVITSTNTTVHSNGWLKLLSTSELAAGTANIGPLSLGSAVEGDVIIERFMNGIGRTYRYLSSPVQNATVSSWKDDFPITGTFDDPSTGAGIRSTAPSMFYYDETHGGLNEGWLPYPATGRADENLLTPGMGYIAFVREASESTIWDVTGPINQGDITFPITYSNTGDPLADGWNLIGNPYPSAIVWAEEGWIRNGSVSNSIAVRDNLTKGFRYWDGQVGQLEGGRIALGQSFWIRTTGAAPSLTITEAAKASEGAAFYRKPTPDYVEVTVSDGISNDQAFFRLREGAENGLDNFDIPKWDNDDLTLSVKDGFAGLAISAVASVSCRTEIPLRLKVSASRLSYLISAKGFGVFEGSMMSIHDHELNVFHDLSSSDYIFNLPAGSQLTERFTLIIESRTPEYREVVHPEFFCSKDSLRIEVTDPQAGIRYVLTADNGAQFVLAGGGNRFMISGDALPGGTSGFTVEARSACQTLTLSDSFQLEKVTIEDPVVKDGKHCRQGSVHLSANSSLLSATIEWFTTNSGEIPDWEGNTFKTPHLTKSRQYFVSVRDSSTGCKSNRIVVTAEIINYDEVTLQLIDGVLASNYQEGNRWYFGDDLIEGYSLPTLEPQLEGLYQVEVVVDECTSRAQYYYYLTSLEMVEIPRARIYPIPCVDRLFTDIYDSKNLQIVDILASNGQSVAYLCRWTCENNSCSFQVDDLPPGMYFLCFAGLDRKRTFARFIKS